VFNFLSGLKGKTGALIFFLGLVVTLAELCISAVTKLEQYADKMPAPAPEPPADFTPHLDDDEAPFSHNPDYTRDPRG
jgi:hypothetical protein